MTILDRFRLDDKVVIITGASSGLGVSFAEACAQAGADVVLAARRVEKNSKAQQNSSRRPVGARSVCRPTWWIPTSARRWSTPRCRSSAASTYW